MANETGADATYGIFPFKDVPRKCLQTINIVRGTFQVMQTSLFKLNIISFIIMLALVQQDTSVDDALPVYAYASPILVRSLFCVRVRVRASMFPLAEVAFLSF